jgi:AP-1 complex subunit sigma 1/2
MSRQGKVRLAKWYSTFSQKERARVVKEATPLVLQRPAKLCNFVDWKSFKLVRGRRVVVVVYALFFCFV